MAIHDNGHAIHSFMRYTTNGNFRIGRDMGWGVANVSFTGSATIDTNLTVSGTSTLTGRVGIGKAPHATYACDVNGTLNATSVLVNGSAVSGSKWTTGTPTTDICYSAGNVNIGTATSQSSYKLNVSGSQFVNNQLAFNNGYRGGGGIDYACNKIALWGGANTPTTSSTFGFGIADATLDYFSPDRHRF